MFALARFVNLGALYVFLISDDSHSAGSEKTRRTAEGGKNEGKKNCTWMSTIINRENMWLVQSANVKAKRDCQYLR
jgi:hypothetical protein